MTKPVRRVLFIHYCSAPPARKLITNFTRQSGTVFFYFVAVLFSFIIFIYYSFHRADALRDLE